MRKSLSARRARSGGRAPARCGRPEKPEFLVFGAASLTESLQDLGEAYDAKTGQRVSSPSAPRATSPGRSRPARRRTSSSRPTRRRWTPSRRPASSRRSDRREFLSNAPRRRRARGLAGEDHLAPTTCCDLPKIALADPAAVRSASTRRSGSRVSGSGTRSSRSSCPTLDVRASLAAVESGAVPAAIVYRTDAAIAKSSKIAFIVERRSRRSCTPSRR